MKHLLSTAVVLAAVSGLAGCAPAQFCARLSYVAERYNVRDASALTVENHPQYRFDTRLRSDLEDAIRLEDIDQLKREGERVLSEARAFAVKATGGEIDRMSDEGIADLARDAAEDGAVRQSDNWREALKTRFKEESRVALQVDVAHLEDAPDLGTARAVLEEIDRRIEAPVADRGKIGRALLAAPLFVPAKIAASVADSHASQQVVGTRFENVFVYRPMDAGEAPSADELSSATDEQLARWYAPVFIQQTEPDASYPDSEDQFGAVFLTGSPDDIHVQIDIQRPTVYWARQEAKFGAPGDGKLLAVRHASSSFQKIAGKKRRKQLVYVAWYPSRPALKTADSEAGLIDGFVIRITLDSHNRPAVYEFVRSCGCYHMLYVAEFLEAEARLQFGGPLPGKQYAIQKENRRKELFIPALVADDGSHPSRPIASVSSGHHLLLGIEAGGAWNGEGKVVSERNYDLKPYETLTHLPLGDGVGSMFGSDGLVHDAGRAEGWWLAPTGMRSAGQPRQLGTMKIRMDSYDYDDPYLLDRQLRVPSGF